MGSNSVIKIKSIRHFLAAEKKKWQTLSGLRGLFLFIIIISFFHLLYKHFENIIVQLPWISSIIATLVELLLISCSWCLNHIFGISSIVSGDLLILPNHLQIQMLPGCSGFQQLFLITIIILIYPGPWKQKIWFIPLSVIVVHLFNSFRFVGIACYCEFYPQHSRFVHDWIFRPLIYMAIFVLWILWDKRMRVSI